ncbi:MAG: hypothetical protein COW54_14685 [Rhodobacteraceae bacterium CG17_big_fil_post_rev_8_21_14_2_50_63_15]|nr:MAG: hypothetical protein COW54_14685 [Rhodobacteraceae bacterium CG17_big_fil_post_rev_8_21_14_2_50_63_15]
MRVGRRHVLLVFEQVPWHFVIRFVVLATGFGLVFPVLILRVRKGLAYAWALHWGYYALTIFLDRALGRATVGAFSNPLFGGR